MIGKKAQVVPIHKKGDRSSPDLPISLTSIVCKTLEHILSTSIYTPLDKYCIIFYVWNNMDSVKEDHVTLS